MQIGPGESEPPVALILAGGKGIRMRRLSEFLPKCSLVVYDQPLLIRLLGHCATAKVQDVFISTNERFDELIRFICQPLSDRFTFHFRVDRSVKGPVLPVLELVKDIGPRKILFLLADIYLEHDTFFQTLAKGGRENEIVLNTFDQPDTNLIRSGCNVVVKGQTVEQIIEKPTEQMISGSTCWTGFAQLPACFFSHLRGSEHFSQATSTGHVGELFEIFRRNDGTVTHEQEKGLVVNISSPDDLMLVNALELRRIGKLRPQEKGPLLKQLLDIYRGIDA